MWTPKVTSVGSDSIIGLVPELLQAVQGLSQGSRMKAVQCRMARAALRIGVRELAETACVSTSTISKLERGESLMSRTAEAVKRALEARGIEFFDNPQEQGSETAGSDAQADRPRHLVGCCSTRRGARWPPALIDLLNPT